MITPRLTPQILTATLPRVAPSSPLHFQPLTIADVPDVRSLLDRAVCRTCDFTIGGTYMWADYFGYRFCIHDETLFMRGLSAMDMERTAFYIPVGALPLARSVDMLRAYCRAHGEPLVFTAVPEEYVAPLRALGAVAVTELSDWADYLYEAEALATMRGKKFNKKRNHVNRFEADNPGFRYVDMTRDMLPAVRSFFETRRLAETKPALADVEREQVRRVLMFPEAYGFEGGVLITEAHGIVAFALGEVRGDTLFVHIEKMNHEVAGAGESICKLFAARSVERHPRVAYINREEDTGDPGLRAAKESYHPTALLRKYDVEMAL